MPSPAVIGSVAVLGIACTAVAFLLFFRLIADAAAPDSAEHVRSVGSTG